MISYRQAARRERLKPLRKPPADGRRLPHDRRPFLDVSCPTCRSPAGTYCRQRGEYILWQHRERVSR